MFLVIRAAISQMVVQMAALVGVVIVTVVMGQIVGHYFMVSMKTRGGSRIPRRRGRQPSRGGPPKSGTANILMF